MVNKKYVSFLAILLFSLAACQKAERVRDRLLKEVENFNVKDFPGIKFDQIYTMEGTYITKAKFEIIPPKLETTRGSDNKKYDDFLIFNSNGTVDLFYAENSKAAKLLISKQSLDVIYGILQKKKEKWIIKTIQAYKMGGGYGTYSQYVKMIDNKIYVQNGASCSVYFLSDEQ